MHFILSPLINFPWVIWYIWIELYVSRKYFKRKEQSTKIVLIQQPPVIRIKISFCLHCALLSIIQTPVLKTGLICVFSWLYTTMCFHIDYNGFLVRWFMFEKTKEWAIISQIVSSHLERRLRGNIIRMYRKMCSL